MISTDTDFSAQPPTDRKNAFYRLVVYAVAIFGALISLLDVIGWAAHIRAFVAVIPGMPAMALSTAICFLLVSIAIAYKLRTNQIPLLLPILLAIVDFIGETWSIKNTPFILVDYRHLHELSGFPPSRMSPITSIQFLILALSLILLERSPNTKKADNRVFGYQKFALAAATIALTNILAFWFGVIHLLGVSWILSMSGATAFLFISYSIAILLTRPQEGVIGMVLSETIAGRSARRLLPVAIVAPITLGISTGLALHMHIRYGLSIAFLIVIGSMILFAVIIWNNTLALNDQVLRAENSTNKLAEIERTKVVTELEATQGQLALALDGARLGSWHYDLVSGKRNWSDQCKRLFGLSIDQEMTLDVLTNSVHPEDRDRLDEARTNSICNSADYFIEYRVIWPDLTIHWIESRGKVTCDALGNAVRFEGISQDVSMRHLLEQRQQQFLRDMLASVTDAKLNLCLSKGQLPTLNKPYTNVMKITVANGGIRNLREAAYEACKSVNQAEERCFDMKMAVAEAAMNAAVHASQGIGQVFVDDGGTVQVMVRDHGSGIALENLPNATLKKGYTTAGTLGHGMKIMLQTVDRIYLMTGSSGTTVIVEQDRESKDIFW